MKPATPFDQLLGLKRNRLPASQGQHLVLDGRRVSSGHDLNRTARQAASDPAVTDPDEALLARLQSQADAELAKKALARAKAAAKYQRQRTDPDAMAKRRAWYEANKDKVRAYKKHYDAANRARVQAHKTAHARRAYHSDPELKRQRGRDYYAANREAILARAQAKRDAARAAKAINTPPPSKESSHV